MLRFALFLAASAGIVRLSWRSLREPRSHGFYRFFAFEMLAALILWNAPLWFREPFSVRQWLSWLLGAASIGLAAEAFRLLLMLGKPSRTEVQRTNLGFENTTTLVTTGAYRFVRHPMYSSLLALAGCAYLKNPSGSASILLTLGTAVFLTATAVAEERENLVRFGGTYALYMKRTNRFVPFL